MASTWWEWLSNLCLSDPTRLCYNHFSDHLHTYLPIVSVIGPYLVARRGNKSPSYWLADKVVGGSVCRRVTTQESALYAFVSVCFMDRFTSRGWFMRAPSCNESLLTAHEGWPWLGWGGGEGCWGRERKAGVIKGTTPVLYPGDKGSSSTYG